MRKGIIIFTYMLFSIFSFSQQIEEKYILRKAEMVFIDLLNEYRSRMGLHLLVENETFYLRSYHQSYYIGKFNHLQFLRGKRSIYVSHEQELDLPNWEEQEDKYYKMDPKWIGENVACSAFPFGEYRTSESIAKKILQNWINSESHRELLLDEDATFISVCFLKFYLGKGGYENIISSTMNLGK